jgi:hypothetical protein
MGIILVTLWTPPCEWSEDESLSEELHNDSGGVKSGYRPTGKVNVFE